MGKPLTEKQLESQRRKIAKDLRSKQYSDIAVQGTNDYSIVSKRSVEKLYSSKIQKALYDNDEPIEYFKHFVKKFHRRSPAINRGYWTRMEAIKQTSYQIIKNSVSQGKKVVIINLGAGYDPLAFQYLDSSNPINTDYKGMLSFVDVDYPDLNKIKIQMIKNSKELSSLIGEEEASDFEGVDLKTKNYVTLSCNLKNIDLFLKQLEYLKLNDESITKIYIAEVSIAYMLPQYADPVIKATSQFPNTHFLLLEQLLPAGIHQGFARTMMFHFNKLKSPLNSVTTYPTIAKQTQRFKDNGFNGTIEAQDLHSFWKSIPKSLRELIDDMEAFDELEEFIVFGQHYLILHATDSNLKLFNSAPSNEQTVEFELQSISLEIDTKPLERKFLAGDATGKAIVINGGCSTSRLKTSLVSTTDEKYAKFNESEIFSGRMSHSLVTLDENTLLLVGGRTAPNRPLDEVWKLYHDGTAWNWEKKASLPSPRSRHSTFKLGGDIYLFGGKLDDAPILKFHDDHWSPAKLVGNLTSKLSSAVASQGSKAVVVGGFNSDGDIESSLHLIELKNNEIVSTLLFEHPLLNRYGAKVVFISEDELLLFGGVSDNTLFNQYTSIVKIVLSEQRVIPLKIENSVWEKFPLLVGFELIKNESSILAIGGGAVCYSFGSIWNGILAYDTTEIPHLVDEINSDV